MAVPPSNFELSLIIFEFSFRKAEQGSCPCATGTSACISLAAGSRSLAGLGDGFAGASGRAFVALTDLFNVVAGLGVRGNFMAEFEDSSLAGVLARQHEIDAIVEPVKQFAKVARSASDVLPRIVRTADPITRARAGHQLHQSARAFR